MWRLKLIGSLLVAILPGWLKRTIYRRLYGYRVGKGASIGFGTIFFGVGDCQIDEGVRIGPCNIFWRTARVSIGEQARIGPCNLFRGGDLISVGPFATILRGNVFNSILDPDVVNLPEPTLQLGAGSVVTTGHWLDFTDRITLGPHSIVGGRHSSFWTHSRQRTRPISIGAHCYLGSEARVAPGVEVPPLCVVALGSVLIGQIEEGRSLVAGNPAACLRELTDSELSAAVRKTRNDIPDRLVNASLPDDLRPTRSRPPSRSRQRSNETLATGTPRTMCGIAGIVDLRRRPVDRPLLERMCGSLRHRGPDDQGCFVNCFAALGQRRLSIIDLSGGQQPMSNEDGTVWVTFNGEIYNFQALRRELTSGAPLRHAQRHGGHRPRLRAVRAGMRAALPRHVRLRRLGPAAATPVPGPRPGRQEAAVLHRGGRPLLLRLGAAGAAGGSGSPPRARRHGHRRLPDLRLHPGPQDRLPGDPQAAAGPLPDAQPECRRLRDSHAALLAAELRAEARDRRGGGLRGAAGGAHRGGPPAADRRRPARRAAERRHRFRASSRP